MTVLAIIQARMNSTRLPGKMTMPLYNGMGPLETMLHRLRRSRRVDRFVVAVTTDAGDDPLAALCARLDVPCHRGAPLDVLDRYHEAYLAHGPARAVVRLTGDCPLHDPEVVDLVVERFLAERPDYAANAMPHTFPDGLNVEVFSPELLEIMWREARLPSEREHVTQYVFHVPGRFTIANVANAFDASAMRWTLDTPEDLAFIRAAIGLMGGIEWSWRDLLARLEARPDIVRINAAFHRNEGLRKSEIEDRAYIAAHGGPMTGNDLAQENS